MPQTARRDGSVPGAGARVRARLNATGFRDGPRGVENNDATALERGRFLVDARGPGVASRAAVTRGVPVPDEPQPPDTCGVADDGRFPRLVRGVDSVSTFRLRNTDSSDGVGAPEWRPERAMRRCVLNVFVTRRWVEGNGVTQESMAPPMANR